MIYLEFEDWVVEAGVVPAQLCCRHSSLVLPRLVALASRVYKIDENRLVLIDVKNRFAVGQSHFISSEDCVILKLRAVLI